jgi:hypothetical protein
MRTDLVGLTITSDDGHVAAINGIPTEDASGLSLQWTYRDSMMLTRLEAGLTVAQVTAELQTRMASIDDAADLQSLMGEVLS